MGIRHLSLAVDDLQAMADALIAKGVQIAGELADCRDVQGQMRTFFVYDPDHILVQCEQANAHSTELSGDAPSLSRYA
jgi:catechol 2,3-dioxygenase-like lactoylglutathione lyase family enzyme